MPFSLAAVCFAPVSLANKKTTQGRLPLRPARTQRTAERKIPNVVSSISSSSNAPMPDRHPIKGRRVDHFHRRPRPARAGRHRSSLYSKKKRLLGPSGTSSHSVTKWLESSGSRSTTSVTCFRSRARKNQNHRRPTKKAIPGIFPFHRSPGR